MCDVQTVSGLTSYLSRVEDDFTRMMLWQTLWDQVLDAKLPLQQFVSILFNHLPFEKNIQSATRVATRFKQIAHYWPNSSDQERSIRHQYILETEELLLSQLEKAKPKSDFQKLWFDTYVSFGESDDAKDKLLQWVTGHISIKGLSIDQDRRWKIIVRLSILGDSRASSLRERETKKDTSEKGAQFSLASLVAEPQKSIKDKWFKKITALDGTLSLARQKAVMSHLFPSTQDHFRELYGKAFFKHLVKLSPHKEPHFLSHYTQQLIPAVGAPSSVHQIKSFIRSHQYLPPIVMKRLKVACQEDERSVNIRQASALF